MKVLGCRWVVEGMLAEPTKTVIAKVISLMPEVAKVVVTACLPGAITTLWLIAGRLVAALVVVAAATTSAIVIAAIA